ncbi:hypothetical protein BDW68DRAFT_147382 [Aspergillus falconensis]
MDILGFRSLPGRWLRTDTVLVLVLLVRTKPYSCSPPSCNNPHDIFVRQSWISSLSGLETSLFSSSSIAPLTCLGRAVVRGLVTPFLQALSAKPVLHVPRSKWRVRPPLHYSSSN